MSVTNQCHLLAVGESVFIECESVSQAKNITRRMTAVSRLPKALINNRYSCAIFTAIALHDGAVIYLNRVKRIK